MTNRRFVRGRPTGALFVVVALAAAGCSSGSPAPSELASALASLAANLPVPSDTPAATQSEQPSTAEQPSETALPSAVVTNIDPCSILTQDEASKFVGITFPAGKEHDLENNAKQCSYDGAGPNILALQIEIAPDVATAKAAEALAKQELDQASNGVKMTVTQLPGFAANTDAAILQGGASGNGISLDGRAIMVLRGTTFFNLSDIALGGKAPSEQAFKDEAMTLLGKLP